MQYNKDTILLSTIKQSSYNGKEEISFLVTVTGSSLFATRLCFYYKAMTIVYNIKNYWSFGLYPSSGIPKN